MLLLASFFALGLGPLIVWVARRQAWSSVFVDAFCVLTISGFALLHLLPECAEHEKVGWLVIPLALVGFLLPTLAERTLHRGHAGMRRLVLLLALVGMAAHDTLDGFFLTDHLGHDAAHDHGHDHSHEVTAWAIILHRIPEGIGIWWIIPRTLGAAAAALVTVVTVGATLFGYFVGQNWLTEDSQGGLALLQALLVGSLLHVVLHAHIPAPRERGRIHLASVAGAAAAVFVLWFVIHPHFPAGNEGPAEIFLRLALESAPALLLAYALVGLCHAFLPANWLQRMTQGPPLVQALRGVAVGLPLPVCSCGVVPIYKELVQRGAALAAAIAFLVATPELELAAVTLTWQLMGGEVALVRAGMAAALALGTGVLVGTLARGKAREPAPASAPAADAKPGLGARLATALRFGYGPAVDSTATWITAGLLLSALLMPYVDRDWIASLPTGIDVPVAALLGLPIYVCATGSTPLAAMLLSQGMSPGAVLAFLLTGPATNITTFGMLTRLHGARTAIVFALSMWVGAVALGFAANLLLPSLTVPALATTTHEHSTWHWIALSALGVVLLVSLLRQGVRPFLERLFESPANLEGAAPAASCCGAPAAADGHGHTHAPGHMHDHDHDHGHDHGPAHSCCHEPPPEPPPTKSCCH